MKPTTWFAVCAGMSLLLAPARAGADCIVFKDEIVWSHPANGARDVPTNTRIWLLLNNWSRPDEVRVNGVSVRRGQMISDYPPERLEPMTDYEVRFRANKVDDSELSFRFTTGSGPATASPPVPVVDRITTQSSRPLSKQCWAVLAALDCYDVDRYTHMVFHSSTQPPFWLIEHLSEAGRPSYFQLWPGECGSPEIYTNTKPSPGTCSRRFRVHAADPSGVTEATAPVCREDAEHIPDPPGGCAMSGAAAGPSALVGTLGLGGLAWLWSRRRRRRTGCRRDQNSAGPLAGPVSRR